MGRKTNPNILRIGNITHSWDARWFADKRADLRQKLGADLKIRAYLNKKLRTASISRVEIARQPRETVLTIHTSRPAVVIGRGGSGIEQIQKDLAGLLKSAGRVRIDVQEVRNPDTDATSIATQVVEQLERRMPFRRILKNAVQRSMQAGARGVRIALAGRLNGAEIARTEWLSDGNVPLHTFRADVLYARRTAFTTFGTIGVKVWVNRGEIEATDEGTPGEAVREAKPKTTKHKRRASLAEKAKKQASRKQSTTKATSRKKK